MQSHQMIIVISVILILFVLVYAIGNIEDEIQLLLRTHEHVMAEEEIDMFFEPLTWSERNLILQNHVQSLEEMQVRLSHTWMAHRFVDYKKKIKELKAQLLERSNDVNERADQPLSFLTLCDVQIEASPLIDKEDLLDFGFLLDHFFSESDIEIYFVDIKIADSKNLMTVDISCRHLDDKQQTLFKNFLHQASDTVFHHGQFDLQVNCSHEENTYYFSADEDETLNITK